jgi:glutamine amidotransferase
MSNMNPRIVIVDYHMGNLFSVQQAFSYWGYETIVTHDKDIIESAECLILPGVGAFGDAMKTLTKFDLVHPIIDHVQAGKPFMGICLGLQLLFSESEEFGSHRGLNLIPGTVKKFPLQDDLGNKNIIPQINWNKIYNYVNPNWNTTPLKKCEKGDFMYFVHSYYVDPDDKTSIASFSEYGGIEYCSSVIKDNIFACQFHPEKSAEKGLNIIKEFLIDNYGK